MQLVIHVGVQIISSPPLFAGSNPSVSPTLRDLSVYDSRRKIRPMLKQHEYYGCSLYPVLFAPFLGYMCGPLLMAAILLFIRGPSKFSPPQNPFASNDISEKRLFRLIQFDVWN